MVDLLLANLAYHIDLEPSEQDFFLSLVRQQLLQKNTLLLQDGQVCRNFYFVAKGCLRTYYAEADGREHVLLFSPEDWWTTDLASFYSQSPALYSIAALENSTVLFISHQHLEILYATIPKFERFFRILVQNGFVMYQQRVVESLSQTAEERYERFQAFYPKLEQRVAQKHIATYLGITPVFLSMLRKKYTR